jgi:hypothetical protein
MDITSFASAEKLREKIPDPYRFFQLQTGQTLIGAEWGKAPPFKARRIL